MTLFDKLKGDIYKTPMTKLASRTNVSNQLNELVDYFNSLTEMLDTTFDRVSDLRISFNDQLQKIMSKVLYFRYILDNYDVEVETHIEERLSLLISNFTTSIVQFVEPYEVNLFNHLGKTDTHASTNSGIDSLDEWERSIATNPTELGIKWFGGKFNDEDINNKLGNLLHIVKVNTIDGHNLEDYITSNPILEIFLYGPKGMSWFVLGRDSGLGYNMITKYQSKAVNFGINVASENYYTTKQYDINKFDLDLIVNTLYTNTDVNGGNVYVKIKTNLPSNTESGLSGFYLSNVDSFNIYEDRKGITTNASKLLYHDNKDIAYLEKELKEIEDLFQHQDNYRDMKPDMLVSPVGRKPTNKETLGKINSFSTKFKTILNPDRSISIEKNILNPKEDKMINMPNSTSGIVVTNNSDTLYFTEDKYFKGFNNNPDLLESDNYGPLYYKGEQIVDLFDYRNIGTLQLIGKNEHMFETDSELGAINSIVTNDSEYEMDKNDKAVYNKLYNNELFDSLNDNYTETKLKQIGLLRDVNNNAFYINSMKHTSLGLLLATTNGIHVFNASTGTIRPTTVVSGIFSSIYEDKNGNIFIGSGDNEGIYRYNPAGGTNVLSFNKTNIVTGSFNNFCECDDTRIGTALAYASTGTIANTGSDYVIHDTIFSYRNGNWYNINDIVGVSYTEPNSHELNTVSSNDLATKIAVNNGIYKTYYNKKYSRYYIFNEQQQSLVMAKSKTPISYEEYIITDNDIRQDINDILYTDDGILYISAESGVYRLDGDELTKLRTSETLVKNGRNVTRFNYYLSGVEDLTETPDNDLLPGKLTLIDDSVIVLNPTGGIKDIIECNNFIYIVSDSRVYKLDKNFKLVGELSPMDYAGSFNKVLSHKKILVIALNNGYVLTDKESIKNNKILRNQVFRANNHALKTKIVTNIKTK